MPEPRVRRQAVLPELDPEEHMRRTLALLADGPSSVVEVRMPRAHPRRGVWSGYFDPAHHAVAVERALAYSGTVPAVYVTLNALNPDLLARAANRLIEAESTTANDHILRWRYILIDTDPVRLSNISSTDAEHAAALDRAYQVRRWLQAQGARGIVIADSGNGGHVLVQVEDLPNTPETTALVRQFLAALAFQFSDETVVIDESTAKPAQLTKLYGTMACKGDSTAERPHRPSRLLYVDPGLEAGEPGTSREVLERIAATAPAVPEAPPRTGPPGTGRRPRGQIDVPALLGRHPDRLRVVRAGRWHEHERWALAVCPWNPEHTNASAYIIQFANGGVDAGCHHASCQGRGWPAFLEAIGETADTTEAPADTLPAAVALGDFYAVSPERHRFFFTPTRTLWPGSSIDARVVSPQSAMNASTWLARFQAVDQVTWAPGEPLVIADRLFANEEWVTRPGARAINLYCPPTLVHGDPALAGPWLDHLHQLYPEEAAHIIRWFAHRVQRPWEKLNHAVVLGGEQGIGKDSVIEPVTYAVGRSNFRDVSPGAVMGRFNDFEKAVILRVSEARDHGDAHRVNRYAFYERTKSLIVAPPDAIRIDEKFRTPFYIPNVVAVLMTTNHRTDALYLPPEDRRHFVAWSDVRRDAFPAHYWPALWRWYRHEGGFGHVAAYLASRDLSAFDPGATPPRTDAWYAIVDTGRGRETDEFVDALAALGRREAEQHYVATRAPGRVGVDEETRRTIEANARPPAAVTIDDILTATVSSGPFYVWLSDRANRAAIPHRMEEAGYVKVLNPAQLASGGRWPIRGRGQQTIYARTDLSPAERRAAAERYVETHPHYQPAGVESGPGGAR
jgi:hypothetical protein